MQTLPHSSPVGVAETVQASKTLRMQSKPAGGTCRTANAAHASAARQRMLVQQDSQDRCKHHAVLGSLCSTPVLWQRMLRAMWTCHWLPRGLGGIAAHGVNAETIEFAHAHATTVSLCTQAMQHHACSLCSCLCSLCTEWSSMIPHPVKQTASTHSPNSNPSTPRTCPSIGLGQNPVLRLYVPSPEVHSESQHTKNMCTRKTSTCRKNTKNCLTASTRRALNAIQLARHPCGAGCKPPCRAHLEMHQWTVACPSIIDPEPRTNAATAVWQGAPCAQTSVGTHTCSKATTQVIS